MCVMGTHHLRYCSLDWRGKIEKLPYDEKRDMSPGRIISIMNDDKYN